MKRGLAFATGALVACVAAAQMPSVDDLLKGVRTLPKSPTVGSGVGATDDKTTAAGIKEAIITAVQTS